jgi:hypothetical protein
MVLDECTAIFILFFTLYIMWQALNLPDDSSFEQGAKIEL